MEEEDGEKVRIRIGKLTVGSRDHSRPLAILTAGIFPCFSRTPAGEGSSEETSLLYLVESVTSHNIQRLIVNERSIAFVLNAAENLQDRQGFIGQYCCLLVCLNTTQNPSIENIFYRGDLNPQLICKISTSFLSSLFEGIFPLRISSEACTITGSTCIVATATTVSPLQ
jgi:hypothetical protein